MTADTEEQAMDVTSTSEPTFPPKWAICVRCKSLPKSRNIVSLPCLHICCSKECVEKFFDNDSPSSCPECYQRFDRDTLHSCSYLNENISLVTLSHKSSLSPGPPPCRSCVREAPAYRWCIDCVEFLCEFCTEHHQYGKMTRGHTLAPTSEGILELDDSLMEGPTDRKCLLHSTEDLSDFCETCEAALCLNCTETPRHVGHSIIPLDTLAKQFEKEFYSGVDILKTIQDKSLLAIKALDSKLKLILTEQKNYMHKEARVFFKRLIDALLKREIQLRKDLVESTLSKAKELNIKKAKVSSLIVQCQQYMDAVQEIVEKGSQWNILHQGQHLRTQFKELAAAHATLTNQDLFDEFVETDCNFIIEENPVQMAENWIDKICQPTYKNLKKKEPLEKMESSDERGTVSPTNSDISDNIKAEVSPMEIDNNEKTITTTTPEKKVAVAESVSSPAGKRQSTEPEKILSPSAKSPRLSSLAKVINQTLAVTESKSQEPLAADSTSAVKASPAKVSPVKASPVKASPVKASPVKASLVKDQESLDEILTQPLVEPREDSGADTQVLYPSTEEEQEKEKKEPPVIAMKVARRSIRTPKRFACEPSVVDQKKSSRTSSKAATVSPVADGTKTGKRPEKSKDTSPVSGRISRKTDTAATPRNRRNSGSSSSAGTANRSRETSLKREKGSGGSSLLVKASTEPAAGEQKKRGRGRPSKSRPSTHPVKGGKDGGQAKVADNAAAEDEPVGELNEYPILREERMKITMEDENEDYCAICLDGGDDVLICCDECPKVFHLKCHMPVINAVPEAEWQCLFCTSYEEILEKFPAPDLQEADKLHMDKLTDREFHVACKFLCELYKVKESLVVRGFYDKRLKQCMNQSPVSLTTMRLRLAMGVPKPFASILDIVKSSRKLLYEAKIFYTIVSKENKVHLDKFEEKYEEILAAYFPLLTNLKYDPTTDEDALKFAEFKAQIQNATNTS